MVGEEFRGTPPGMQRDAEDAGKGPEPHRRDEQEREYERINAA
jgi:hypothetical protein